MAVLFQEEREQLIIFRKSTTAQRLALFCYQMGAMLEAGLPLLFCLELNRQQSSGPFQQALLQMEQDLKEGSTLAGALGKHPRFFPVLMVTMIEAGELGGILPQVFGWLANHFERENKLREKIKSALVYPMLVLILTLLSLLVLGTVVLPGLTGTFQQMGVPIPAVTRIILGAGKLLCGWWYLLAPVILVGAAGLYSSWQRPEGRLWWEGRLLRLPLFGDLKVKGLAARFCRLLGALLAHGVPVIQAVTVVKKTLGNPVVQNSLDLALSSLQEGKGLARPLAEGRLFPVLMVQMVASGEETGRLPEFLHKLSIYYEQEVERTLDRLTALLEPILVLLLGCLVGGVVLAMLAPMLSLLQAL